MVRENGSIVKLGGRLGFREVGLNYCGFRVSGLGTKVKLCGLEGFEVEELWLNCED